MTVIESIINKMLNRWYMYKDAYGYFLCIKLANELIYHGDSLEFYTIRFSSYHSEFNFDDGFYDTMKLGEIAKFAPIEEMKLSDNMMKAFAKELLDENN